MKKFLLSLLLGIVGFVGFSSAENLSLSCNNGFCTPLTFSFSQGDVINSYNDGTNGECNITLNGSFSITDNDGNDYSCTTIIFNNGRIECNGSYYPTLPYIITSNSNLNFDNYNCQNDKIPNPNFSYTPIPSGGGNDNVGGSIVTGGFGTFTPLLTGITTLLGEFIPYVVYLGLGILICILSFIAIKYLMSWVSKRVTKTFK